MTNPSTSASNLREIYDKHGGNLTKVAEELGLSLDEFVSELGSKFIPSPSMYPMRRRTPPADLGKDSMRKYIVSIRHVDSSVWPREDQIKIDDARNMWEAGTHEMCQGRDRGWFILYLIPRKQRTGARKFFRAHD